MKAYSIFTVIALAIFVGCGAVRQTPQERQDIQKALDNRSYQIDINYMIPMRGMSKSVSGYSLTVEGDSIDSQLPYIGQAQSIPYGGGKGLSFQADINSYTDKGLEKDCRTIVIDVRNDEDHYVYTLDIFDSGDASVSVRCDNRDDISYRGSLNTDYKKQ